MAKNKKASEEENISTGDSTTQDPVQEGSSNIPEVSTEPKISLHNYCNTLSKDGVDKFAYVRINAKLNERKDWSREKTYSEWEKIYLEIKNS